MTWQLVDWTSAPPEQRCVCSHLAEAHAHHSRSLHCGWTHCRCTEYRPAVPVPRPPVTTRWTVLALLACVALGYALAAAYDHGLSR